MAVFTEQPGVLPQLIPGVADHSVPHPRRHLEVVDGSQEADVVEDTGLYWRAPDAPE